MLTTFLSLLKQVNNNTFIRSSICHEQEIPEVIPIEDIPFLNQSKSNQLNLRLLIGKKVEFFEKHFFR